MTTKSRGVWYPPSPISPKRSCNTSGFIYLAQAGTGHHKIGYSFDPARRIRHFDAQMPVTVSLVHSFPADIMAEAEAVLHAMFAGYRVKGEWFLLPDAATAFICAIAGYERGDFVMESGGAS